MTAVDRTGGQDGDGDSWADYWRWVSAGRPRYSDGRPADAPASQQSPAQEQEVKCQVSGPDGELCVFTEPAQPPAQEQEGWAARMALDPHDPRRIVGLAQGGTPSSEPASLPRQQREDVQQEGKECTCWYRSQSSEDVRSTGSHHDYNCSRHRPAPPSLQGGDDDTVTVSWRDCSCEWATKFCDEMHTRTTNVSRAVLRAAGGGQ